MKYYAILVAGGTGSRMNSDLPKQFLLINGKPVLMHTIEAFASSKYKPEIIVVLHAEYYNYWKECIRRTVFEIPHTIIPGGESRFQSVKNGLDKIKEKSLIAIHDAVRPVISQEIINSSFEVAEKKGNSVAAIKSRDSVRQIRGECSEALDRETIYLIQTPQTFSSEIIKKAYDLAETNDFTDDATVVEKLGININLITGSSKNIKITFPEDLLIASEFLKRQ